MMDIDTSSSSSPNSEEEGTRNLFSNLTVGWKLNILIIVMALGTLGVFITGLRGLQTLRTNSSTGFNAMFAQINTIARAETVLADIQAQVEALNNPTLTPTEQNARLAAIENANKTINGIIEEYKQGGQINTNNQDFAEFLRGLDQAGLQADEVATFDKFTTAYNDFLANYNSFNQSYIANGYNNELAIAAIGKLQEARSQVSHLIEISNENTQILSQAIDKKYQDTVLRQVIALILAIAYGLMVSFSTARSLTHRLAIVENAAIAYQDGYLDRRSVIDVGGNDELSRVATAFNNLFNQMQSTLVNLEERVDERTASLAAATKESERRARQFEAITLVGNAVSSIRSLDELLPKITDLISRQFGYYHVGIFLNDTVNEYTVLSAANSEGGKRMLERGHQLKIGEQGIVGHSIHNGKPRIALDVGEDATYFDNPDMPNTRSELSLPLKIGDEVVGALDVQSTEPAAFGQEDISVLSLLANQVGLVIENARLFDQARKSLAESEALYRQYIRQAWNRLPKEQDLAGYQYSTRGAVPIKARENVTNANTTSTTLDGEAVEDKSRGVSVPISIRGETIGTLLVRIPQSKSINEDQVDLVNAVAERVALSAENARLFEETTRRAERERLVSDITVKIRSTNDPSAMIQTALNELKVALGATHVQLVPHTLQKSNNGNESLPLPDEKSNKKRK